MVQIKIDQAPLPPGVAGVAREDLALGSPATLTAVGGPYLRYQWRIISKPLDLSTQLFSAAVLSIPDASVTLLQPVDVIGTYLVEVSVDSGAGLGARATDVSRITFYAGPTLGSAPGTFPRRIPATGETTEHNVAGNQEGWAAELRFWLAAIQAQNGGRFRDRQAVGPVTITDALPWDSFMIDDSGGPVVINLPTAVGVEGTQIRAMSPGGFLDPGTAFQAFAGEATGGWVPLQVLAGYYSVTVQATSQSNVAPASGWAFAGGI